MREIDFFVQMCELEQLAELSGQLPSVESYQRCRMGTSAVTICLALHEYDHFFAVLDRGIRVSSNHQQVHHEYAIATTCDAKSHDAEALGSDQHYRLSVSSPTA